jgi:hypothetical protein
MRKLRMPIQMLMNKCWNYEMPLAPMHYRVSSAHPIHPTLYHCIFSDPRALSLSLRSCDYG